MFWWSVLDLQYLIQILMWLVVYCLMWLAVKINCMQLQGFPIDSDTFMCVRHMIMGGDQCQNVELFSGRWICVLLFIMGDNFYIQINYNTFGIFIQIQKHIWHDKFYIRDTFMTNSISKWRNTFGMTNSISKWRDTFGMTNSVSNLNMVTFTCQGYDVHYMELQVCLSSGEFGMLQRIVNDLAMNDDWRGIQLDLIERGYLLPTWVRKITLPTFQLNAPVVIRAKVPVK